MSLAFSADATVSVLPSPRGKTRREALLDLAFAMPFAILVSASIMFLVIQPSIPQAEQAMMAFAER